MKIYLVDDICSPEIDSVAIKAFRTKEDAQAELNKTYNEFVRAHYIPDAEPLGPGERATLDSDATEFEYATLNDGPGKIVIHTRHVDDNAKDIWVVHNRCYPALHIKGMPTIVSSQQEGVKLLESLSKKYEEPVHEYYKRGMELPPDFSDEDAVTEIDQLNYMEAKNGTKRVWCAFCLRKVHIS